MYTLFFDYRGVANGIFSWGVYYGYGLAYVYGIYITEVRDGARKILVVEPLRCEREGGGAKIS